MQGPKLLTKAKETAIKAVKEAGNIQLKYLGKVKSISKKADKTFVTHIDIECEKKIISLIKKQFPDHAILAEESGKSKENHDYIWIIDPLDGTHNYMKALPIFGVSIALEHKKKIILGVIYLPIFDELYIAIKGKGAFCNNKKLNVSKIKDLKDSTIFVTSHYHGKYAKKIAQTNKIAKHVLAMHSFGSAVFHFAMVASGKAESMISFSHPWDKAAGILLVEEANGKVTDMKGRKTGHYTTNIVVSNGKAHGKLIDLLR